MREARVIPYDTATGDTKRSTRLTAPVPYADLW